MRTLMTVTYVKVQNFMVNKKGNFTEWTIQQKIFAVGGVVMFSGMIAALIAKSNGMITSINGW